MSLERGFEYRNKSVATKNKAYVKVSGLAEVVIDLRKPKPMAVVNPSFVGKFQPCCLAKPQSSVIAVPKEIAFMRNEILIGSEETDKINE